jgi:cytochrome b561
MDQSFYSSLRTGCVFFFEFLGFLIKATVLIMQDGADSEVVIFFIFRAQMLPLEKAAANMGQFSHTRKWRPVIFPYRHALALLFSFFYFRGPF